MYRLRTLAILCVLLAAATGGCWNSVRRDMSFDRRGWGGPNLEYSIEADGLITIKSGMLVNEDFRWAESEFSFDFLDRRDLTWGVLLMDSVFVAARREALRKTHFKTGDTKFTLGKDLPADQLWKFDMALSAEFRRDKSSRGYKVLDGVWYEQILDSGRMGVRISATRDVRIKPNVWNTFRARITGGKFVFVLNGVEGLGVIQIDQRTNGRLGIFVRGGGPFLIRNLRFGPVVKPKQ